METQEVSRLRKVISKDQFVPGCPKKKNGFWTGTDEEVSDLLFETHFTGCTNADILTDTVKATSTPRVLNSVKSGQVNRIIVSIHSTMASKNLHKLSISQLCTERLEKVREVFIPKDEIVWE